MINDHSLEDNIYERGFHVIDNFLDHHNYQVLSLTIQTLYQKNQFRQAKVADLLNSMEQSNIRGDKILWLGREAANASLSAYFQKIDMITHQLNQSLFLGLIDFEAHFSVYEPGTFYRKHIDQFQTTQDRRISFVYYLNDDWQPFFAGQLNIYDRNDQLIANILPIKNRFICFSSDLPHEVCETKQIRYSITGWIKVRSMTG